MCTFIRDEVVRPNLGAMTDKYIYYIWTVFFFILFANVLGLIPFGYILQSLTGNTHFSHWGGSATGNLSLNVMLAICSFIAILYIGIRETGFKTFLAHFNPLGWDDPKMLVIGHSTLCPGVDGTVHQVHRVGHATFRHHDVGPLGDRSLCRIGVHGPRVVALAWLRC